MSNFTILNLLLPKVSYSPGQPVLKASLQAEAKMFDNVESSAALAEGA